MRYNSDCQHIDCLYTLNPDMVMKKIRKTDFSGQLKLLATNRQPAS